MALSYNELKPGTLFVFNGAPHRVLEYEFLRMQQRKPVTRLKIKNLITGKAYEHTAHAQDTFEEADISINPLVFIYTHRDECWFHEAEDSSRRTSLPLPVIGPGARFLAPKTIVNALIFQEKIIGIELPIKVDLKVIEAPPSIRGNTAQGGTKVIKLETGAEISAPLFIKEGDLVRVNTQTGEYVERA